MRLRLLAGHAGMLSAAVGLIVLGLTLLEDRDLTTLASAASGGPDLEISHYEAGPYGESADGVWILPGGAAAQPVTGNVWLRTARVRGPDTAGVWLRADLEGFTLLDHLEVTAMSLGGADLLPLWKACSPGGSLMLVALRDCASPPALPLPPPNGALFRMTLEIERGTSNAWQGNSTGSVRFVFTLEDTDSNVLPESPGAPQTPESPPAPPATGTGLRQAQQSGYAILLAALALLGGWAAGSTWILLAARRRRRERDQ